jgi:peptide-methionine (S)-S-oxide reductase
VTYSQLLDLFWDSHNPCGSSYSRQYLSAVFYNTPEQKRLALESVEQQAKVRGRIATPVLPATKFTLAEDYHQKYYLKQSRELAGELRRYYPDEKDFTNSTAVTRANAYVGGHGGLKQLEAELPTLGLSESAGARLRDYVRR